MEILLIISMALENSHGESKAFLNTCELSICNIYSFLQTWIAQQCPIHRRTIGFQELLQEGNVTLVPGEVYPYSVHVISSRAQRDSAVQGGEASYLESMEPCCGTHLLNTAHIGTFVIESVVRDL